MGYENYLQLYTDFKKRMLRNNELGFHLTFISLMVEYLHLFKHFSLCQAKSEVHENKWKSSSMLSLLWTSSYANVIKERNGLIPHWQQFLC